MTPAWAVIFAMISAGAATLLWSASPTAGDRLDTIRRIDADRPPDPADRTRAPGRDRPYPAADRGDPTHAPAGYEHPSATTSAPQVTTYRHAALGTSPTGPLTGSWRHGTADHAPTTAGRSIGVIRRRIAATDATGRQSAPGPFDRPPQKAGPREFAFAGVAAAVAVLLAGGTAGILAGVLLFGVVLFVLRGRQSPAARREMSRIAADLPFATDLMVACLRAGRPLSGAVETAATTIGGPLGHRLSWVSMQLRLGADPQDAWQALIHEPATARLARTMTRAALTGTAVAESLTRLGDDAVAAARATSSAAARRVAVQTVAPLGLCFLPAFVLLGIIPVIAALASQVLIP
ncbi:hypothetical protein Misp01_40750 [Microtetraspora sp. NBRC 13810]|uniref:type II secretion system F family protein n=1 Tax=Microtetraspora sp. NBRC 13810 TaxID=3030990 RepID=UPI002556C96E|nr:type II secretion system F family protein [Microtetraspora sp. NBRC 13810]GLW08945.1 hypothetical protein Misp01_40750 [Microtetraspora sp. NBRC 13810]